MRLIAWILLAFLSFSSVIFNIYRKIVMRDFGVMNLRRFLSIKTWVEFFFEPRVMFLLFLSLGWFALYMTVFSLASVNEITGASWLFSIPSLFLTIFLTKRILGEEVIGFQRVGLLLLIISMILGGIGSYFFARGVRA